MIGVLAGVIPWVRDKKLVGAGNLPFAILLTGKLSQTEQFSVRLWKGKQRLLTRDHFG